MRRRASGILLHVSSLPTRFGIGDLGPDAYQWVDCLVEARQSIWQVLPLGPTTPRGGNSPYQPTSAFAGNSLFISPRLLCDEQLLTEEDLQDSPVFPEDRIEYPRVISEKKRLFDLAFSRFEGSAVGRGFTDFCEKNAPWLDDFAFFTAAHERFRHRIWSDWPAPCRDKDPGTLDNLRRDMRRAVEREKFLQYVFHTQWSRLKQYANQRGVRIIGDLPFYVGYECADVWGAPELFKLDEGKKRKFVAGVPPDGFSADGQLWGSPVYDWEAHARTHYAWWIARLRHNLDWFDLLRIDHFRGFASYWQVPAEHTTAVDGEWVPGPGEAFFDALLEDRPSPRFIAEDLGTITPDVRHLMRRSRFPGMKVLLFAFDGDTATNPYSLHNHSPNSVLYTGTHDNNTARGWYENDATPEQKNKLHEYLGTAPSPSHVHWELIRLAMMSVSRTLIIPMQDALGLGAAARMNHPAVVDGNWEWRMRQGAASSDLARSLAELSRIYGRT